MNNNKYETAISWWNLLSENKRQIYLHYTKKTSIDDLEFKDIHKIYKKVNKDCQRISIVDFFDKYPIKATPFAKKYGFNPSLMRKYAADLERPSAVQLIKIEKCIHQLAKDLLSIKLTNVL